MRSGTFTFQILIKGKSIQEYFHEGRTYVEGRDGSEFELEFRNDSNNTVMMIPSVDGLCTLDGQAAGSQSKGYIVKPWRNLIIPGWTLDSTSAAKFQFESKQTGQYVNQVTGTSANAGVIGCIVFEEDRPTQIKKTEYVHVPYPVPQPYPVPYYPYVPVRPYNPWRDRAWACNAAGSGISGSLSSSNGGTGLSNINFGSAQCSAKSVESNQVLGAGMDGLPQYMSINDTAANNHATGIPSSSSQTLGNSTQPSNATIGIDDVPELLGTAFGAKTEFKTTTETFKRGRELTRSVIYYKTRRDLERMGIRVVTTPYQRAATEPNPFPGETGCKPPPGWNG